MPCLAFHRLPFLPALAVPALASARPSATVHSDPAYRSNAGLYKPRLTATGPARALHGEPVLPLPASAVQYEPMPNNARLSAPAITRPTVLAYPRPAYPANPDRAKASRYLAHHSRAFLPVRTAACHRCAVQSCRCPTSPACASRANPAVTRPCLPSPSSPLLPLRCEPLRSIASPADPATSVHANAKLDVAILRVPFLPRRDIPGQGAASRPVALHTCLGAARHHEPLLNAASLCTTPTVVAPAALLLP